MTALRVTASGCRPLSRTSASSPSVLLHCPALPHASIAAKHTGNSEMRIGIGIGIETM